jgi:DNA-binding beta-propeller fold protein YncE
VLSCKVDVSLAAPEGVLVDGDRVLVAESRGRGVTSFITSTLPTSNRATGGCATHDASGAALAIGVVHSPWLQNAAAARLTQPAAVTRANSRAFYVSSPRTGVIAEVDPEGRFVRRILTPPAGAVAGRHPLATGSPMGLGVAPDGTLYYADSGFVTQGGRLVAGLRTGTIRRISFAAGNPQPPVVVASGLEAPDGIGIWIPSA